MAEWEGKHVQGSTIKAPPQDLRDIRARLASYDGPLRHANSYRLRQRLVQRFAWLPAATSPRRFSTRQEGRRVSLKF
ncbi:hypothetical protein DB774_06300 [Xanthomonas perforans]|nr:hypothetical protein DB774_06300 [Xanthomonas perforans]